MGEYRPATYYGIFAVIGGKNEQNPARVGDDGKAALAPGLQAIWPRPAI
jgi:hypothetical protein